MTTSHPRQPRPGASRQDWRQQWADRTNQRRQHAYAATYAAWRQQDEYADWLLGVARDFAPARPEEPPAWLPLHRNETLYWTGAHATMLETPWAAGLARPDPAALSIYPGAVGAAPATPPGNPIDLGTVAITSKRVIFAGRNRREWSLSKLLGTADRPDRSLLMHVSNRKKISGIRTRPADAHPFRLYLALALADAAGDREPLQNSLTRQHEQLRRAEPAKPATATAEQAPPWAWLASTAGVLTSTAAGVAMLASLCLVGTVLAGDPTEVAAPAPVSPTPVVTESPRPEPPPAPRTPRRSPTPSPTPEPTTEAPPPPPPPEPEPEPEPEPAPVDLCGAPPNPYGYNFCGGANVTDPPGDICQYFDCIGNFWNGKGYMIQCESGKVSMSGGRQGSCSHHGGNRRAVYQ